jgi:hypothetical protein
MFVCMIETCQRCSPLIFSWPDCFYLHSNYDNFVWVVVTKSLCRLLPILIIPFLIPEGSPEEGEQSDEIDPNDEIDGVGDDAYRDDKVFHINPNTGDKEIASSKPSAAIEERLIDADGPSRRSFEIRKRGERTNRKSLPSVY